MISDLELNKKHHWIFIQHAEGKIRRIEVRWGSPCILQNDEDFKNGLQVLIPELRLDGIQDPTHKEDFIVRLQDAPSWLINKCNKLNFETFDKK